MGDIAWFCCVIICLFYRLIFSCRLNCWIENNGLMGTVVFQFEFVAADGVVVSFHGRNWTSWHGRKNLRTHQNELPH